MLRSLNSGVSGVQQFQQQMDVIGNNIANVNTTGFKSARVGFADAFSQTLRTSAAGSGSTSSTSPLQVGTGVQTTSIQNQFIQGSISRTGVPTDIAISGSGFFVVRDATSGETFVTRAGDFRLDSAGYLVTNNGLRVQGFNDSALSTRGDILVDSGITGVSVASYSFGSDGKLNLRLSNGSEMVRGQILLQNFSDPQSLTKEGDNLYSGLAAAGPLSLPAAPRSPGLGTLESGAVELSNVDLANEFSTLITTQRAFQAASRIITTSDEMLQELVNLKR
jgi:flagellar hook protein FlgE